jgi:hypothetical protein
MVFKHLLGLPKDFLRSLVLSPTGIKITDMEEAYLFKSVSNLLIAGQPSSKNYPIAKNFAKKLSFY